MELVNKALDQLIKKGELYETRLSKGEISAQYHATQVLSQFSYKEEDGKATVEGVPHKVPVTDLLTIEQEIYLVNQMHQKLSQKKFAITFGGVGLAVQGLLGATVYNYNEPLIIGPLIAGIVGAGYFCREIFSTRKSIKKIKSIIRTSRIVKANIRRLGKTKQNYL